MRESDKNTVPQQVAWYAIQLRPKFEKKTDALLRCKGIETFLPLLAQIHQWSDRRKRVLTPLFPGYEFIRMQPSMEVRKTVLETEGVISFVGSQHGAAVVPLCQVEALQRLLRARVDCAIRPFLHAGQRVRIRGGALDCVEGTMLEDTRKHLVVSVDCIQWSVLIAIDGYDLELV